MTSKNISLFDIFNIFEVFTFKGTQFVGAGKTNVCIEFGDDGADTLFGYQDANFGSTIPDTLEDGTKFYELTYQADGTITMKFGADGKAQLANIYKIMIGDNEFDETVILVWDDAITAYTISDATYANKVIDQYKADGELNLCLFVAALPDLFISYRFNEIEIGG
jgi:hypothetical protein